MKSIIAISTLAALLLAATASPSRAQATDGVTLLSSGKGIYVYALVASGGLEFSSINRTVTTWIVLSGLSGVTAAPHWRATWTIRRAILEGTGLTAERG